MRRALALAALALACGGAPAPVPPPSIDPGPGPAPTKPVPIGAPAVEAAPVPATNLQVLPAGTSRAEVEAFMRREVAPGLGVECSFCHVEGDYASDANGHKVIARDMLRMQVELNRSYFDGKGTVSCYTCHHGEKEPGATSSGTRAPGRR
jgi:hypothetical protein